MRDGDNAMIYAFAAIAAVAFALGYGLADKVSAEKIAVLEHAIIEANLSMDAVLQAHIAQKKQNELEAEAKSVELEKSYEQSVATVNAYYDRVQSSHKARSRNTMPVCEGSGTSEGASATTEFERQAYTVDAWAESCYQFVNDNCGMTNGMDR